MERNWKHGDVVRWDDGFRRECIGIVLDPRIAYEVYSKKDVRVWPEDWSWSFLFIPNQWPTHLSYLPALTRYLEAQGRDKDGVFKAGPLGQIASGYFRNFTLIPPACRKRRGKKHKMRLREVGYGTFDSAD